MTEQPLFIPLLLGTVRQGRESEKVARWLLALLENRQGVATILVDPRDLHLPMEDEGEDLKEQNLAFKEMVERADGLLIVSPEYNHSYPGSLKRMLDVLYPEYARRAVAVCGVSDGRFGGARMLEHVHSLVHTLGLIESKTDLYVPNVLDFFDEQGNPRDLENAKRAEKFIEELIWLATSLRWGRQNILGK